MFSSRNFIVLVLCLLSPTDTKGQLKFSESRFIHRFFNCSECGTLIHHHPTTLNNANKILKIYSIEFCFLINLSCNVFTISMKLTVSFFVVILNKVEEVSFYSVFLSFNHEWVLNFIFLAIWFDYVQFFNVLIWWISLIDFSNVKPK